MVIERWGVKSRFSFQKTHSKGKNYIYNDNFTLNVLDLNQCRLYLIIECMLEKFPDKDWSNHEYCMDCC